MKHAPATHFGTRHSESAQGLPNTVESTDTFQSALLARLWGGMCRKVGDGRWSSFGLFSSEAILTLAWLLCVSTRCTRSDRRIKRSLSCIPDWRCSRSCLILALPREQQPNRPIHCSEQWPTIPWQEVTDQHGQHQRNSCRGKSITRALKFSGCWEKVGKLMPDSMTDHNLQFPPSREYNGDRLSTPG